MVSVIWNGADRAIKAVITELRPLGIRHLAGRAGDHDGNTLRLCLDPKGELAGLEPGMTVLINNWQRQQCSCRLFSLA
jgi:HlyD family secretion protein